MKNLDELRVEIDAIDKDLAKLLKRRLDVSLGVAKYKSAHNLPIHHKDREIAILDAFAKDFSDEEAPFARAFLKGVIRQSREYQYYLNRNGIPNYDSNLNPELVFYPGVAGSHSSICAYELYPDATLCPCVGFAEVFEQIRNNECAVGVLPIDNSTAGTVGDVYDLLTKSNFSIVHSTTRSISHYLLAPKGATKSNIKQVYSHPQALAQCSGYLKKNGYVAIEASNTAVAAEYVASLGDTSVAAIASKETAVLYGLDILDEKINDEYTNQTRFICISKKQFITDDANRISLAFNLPNEPGALSDILAAFSDFGVNLTKILSRPIPDKPWEYTFYLDCVYSAGNEYLNGLLTHLKAELPSMKLLGIYHEEEIK